MTEKFPIGFWNYTSVGQLGPEAVRDWKDLGMTVAMSPEYNHTKHKKEDLIAILDECETNGIKVIVCDERGYWGHAYEKPEEYEVNFRAAYDDFGKHPAVIGFHVGDEPCSELSFNSCKTAYKIQLKVAPKLVPFVNYLPYWKAMEKTIFNNHTFEEWATDMIIGADLKMMCYDHYWQMNPEEDGTDSFFTNIHKYYNAAKEKGIPLWTTLLSVGHFRYRCPSEDDMRWQLNTAVASGCKGILWFFIYMREPQSNYRISPIDEFNERTESYEHLSRVNRHFLHRFGNFFISAELEQAYHLVKSYGGYPLFEKGISDVITEVISEQGLPGIVSFFEKDGEKFLVVANNSPFASCQYTIHVSNKANCFDRLTWNGSWVSFDEYCGDANYTKKTDGNRVCGEWMAPGQMYIYRYSKK